MTRRPKLWCCNGFDRSQAHNIGIAPASVPPAPLSVLEPSPAFADWTSE